MAHRTPPAPAGTPGTLPEIPPEVLAVLVLPALDSLSDTRARGATCVWCPARLTPDTAYDLGDRPHPAGGRAFPRGCRRCVQQAILAAYSAHSRDCVRCEADPTTCTLRRALRRTALEARR
jgi:hypothetical protein